jgi:hypothetical protein
MDYIGLYYGTAGGEKLGSDATAAYDSFNINRTVRLRQADGCHGKLTQPKIFSKCY